MYSSMCRNVTTVACVPDHEVEMESDTDRRRRRLTRVYKCSDTIEQRMLPGASNDERLTNPNSIGPFPGVVYTVCTCA